MNSGDSRLMNSTIETLCDDTVWGEAPRRQGDALWSSDTQAAQLLTVSEAGVARTALAEPSNGIWFLPDGRLAIARWHAKRIDVLEDGESVLHADLSDLARAALGDMAGAPDGRLYVDDMGEAPHSGAPIGRVLVVDPDGSARVAAEGLRFPNGIAVLEDTLIVAETHAMRLTAFDIESDGTLKRPRTWADLAKLLSERHRPDGIWPAPDGSIWVATTTGEEFVRVDGSRVIDRVPTPGEFAIACCLDGSSLYLSASRSTDPDLDLLSEALPQKKVRGRIARVEVAT
ncbi:MULTISPECIES: SMP-30/gluconolactonase/LRE family protein [Streptomyces]|uniref:SMP-30/gluconolactonase/LRE family protein n=3 Tax=Streptomyces TaxID=1883 RepID=A0ABD5JQR2_9ACTN|nr:SMP-30/gluconolactonase/LRE family protein [Streptomyces sp. AgN23]MEE4590013.1 SMP-30/gluconolactonase/LRE family protein [Streptomyces sp. DSM 41602]QTI87311.1 SMP-30/gluconolactonase/LRE family protein [Streptomyces sp. AgN23]WTA78607.1 SMP-30/gluconolactonase/LRE family protein [Streptomyces antimycoticus]